MDSDSCSQKQLDDLLLSMISFYEGQPKRILHFMKVHSFSRIIGIGESLDDTTLLILEAAAYTHELEPAYAQQMLSELGFENYMIERICYLIEPHDNCANADGMDYQILLEADYLVKLFEDEAGMRTIQKTYENIFKTGAGKRIFQKMYGYAEET